MRNYYIFINVLDGSKTLVNEENYKRKKEELGIQVDARASNNIYNGYLINRHDNKNDALEDLVKPYERRAVLMGQKVDKETDTRLYTYKKEVLNIISKQHMAEYIENIYNELKNRGADKILIRFTYSNSDLRPIYRTYDISFPMLFEELVDNLKNGEKIEYYQDDGTTRNYESDGFHLDFSNIIIYYRAKSQIVGAKNNKIKTIEYDKVYVDVFPSREKTKKEKYNCLQDLLYLLFNDDEKIKRTIRRLILKFPTYDQTDSHFKVELPEECIELVEKSLDIAINIISDFNGLEKVYSYKSNKYLDNVKKCDILTHDEHVYLIKAITPKEDKETAKEIKRYIPKYSGKFELIFYDFETCYYAAQRKHIPTYVASLYDNEGKVFYGKNMIKEMIQYYEQMLPNCCRIYMGFNSSKFDIFFILNYLIEHGDNRPKIKFLKDKLYVESEYNIFHDLLPLMSMDSLDGHCKKFKLLNQKLKDDISFRYHNYIFNHPEQANGDLDTYYKILKTTIDEKHNNRSLHDTMENYCLQDCRCTKELYEAYQSAIDSLLKKLPPLILYRYKTLGDMSIAILLCTQEQSSGKLKLIKKDKRTEYKYSAILKSDIKHKCLEEQYKALRTAIIASISYAKNNSKISDSTSSLIDVVSLYPYVLQSDKYIYGYGELIIADNITLNMRPLPLGIYKASIEFKNVQFQRLPAKPENGSYKWVHNETLNGYFYAQDINNSMPYANITIEDGYVFEKQGTGAELYGTYMSLFTHEKNRQDLLKEDNDCDYNAGVREACKAFMNIASGKLVQIYGYESKYKALYKSTKDCLDEDIVNGNIIDGDSITICKIKTDMVKNSEKLYTFDLVGAQLYCYAREHMQKMIERVVKNGYEPYVIETDSIITNREFILNDRLNNPTEYVDGLPKFGQFNIENEYIKLLYVYSKKSYFFKTKDGQEKFRFKGTSKSAIIPSLRLKTFIKYYNQMKSYYEDCYRKKILIDGEIKSKLSECNQIVSNFAYHEMQKKGNKIVDKGEYVFAKLVNKEPLIIVQEILKKNYITSSNEQMTIENVLIMKEFNDPIKKEINKRDFNKAYKEIMSRIDSNTLKDDTHINQRD